LDIKRVLVIYKKSTFELYSEDYRDPSFLSHIRAESAIVTPFLRAHEDNVRARALIRAALDESGLHHDWVYRARKRSTDGYDLIVTIGGDGTLLDASHAVVNTPVLGVNSSPRYSVGHFCAANGDTFGEVLHLIRTRQMPDVHLLRMQLRIGDRSIPYPALNDVLFAHPIPAAMSRYILCADGVRDEHKSSGVWVATAAGSTAAIHSAGGTVMPLESRGIQYLARELYHTDHDAHPLGRGITMGALGLVSKMRQAAVYIDGHRIRYNVAYGETVVLEAHRCPLRLFWKPEEARKRLPTLR
jgi:NAD+ kinase